jgi:hypothetical protein
MLSVAAMANASMAIAARTERSAMALVAETADFAAPRKTDR